MNHANPNTKPTVLFVDMNSFFASCEQQVNYWLRERPVAVCVYTGRNGCVISPSIEAKRRGVRVGMRLDDAIKVCPDLVPLETNPARYRDFHIKIMEVLKTFSADVFPRSIDEAIVDLTHHQLMYPNIVDVGHKVKAAIRRDVGDWLRCSIGVAPNAFLAKLASGLQKPDGLVCIDPENIDRILSTLRLTDLPGIGSAMAARLQAGGIDSPLHLRQASPEKLRQVVRSVVGLHWHYRLNFGGEMDLTTPLNYKSMQAMRSLSAEQRQTVEDVHTLFMKLCFSLEKRLVTQSLFCKAITFSARYTTSLRYEVEVRSSLPIQDGAEIHRLLLERIKKAEHGQPPKQILSIYLSRLHVGVYDFVPAEMVQYTLFENNTRRDLLRKAYYDIKTRFGNEAIMRVSELKTELLLKDVIGFGSIGDLRKKQGEE
ncbi:DNA polymerase IV [Rhabdobacter roseus]|uniref:DNA polymerase-4 n=1 Tax=Rhabdobacter roseus TaxID=1655419 RepID=A0A840U3Q3_9BACT|nr:DNA polymerase IV [Rhabdobacter roseus]MBB5286740.1 DNA polymerase-4 [Rhabdobacter roseus]